MGWSRIIGIVGSGFALRAAAAVGALFLAHAVVVEVKTTFNQTTASLNVSGLPK